MSHEQSAMLVALDEALYRLQREALRPAEVIHLRFFAGMMVDETATMWKAVYVSGGRRGLDLAIAPADLVAVTGAIVSDVSRW